MDRLAYNVKKAGLGDMVKNDAQQTGQNGGAGSVPTNTENENPSSTGSVEYVQFDFAGSVYAYNQDTVTVTVKYEVTDGVLLNYLLWESFSDGKSNKIANATFKQTAKGNDGQDATYQEPFENVTDSLAVLDLEQYEKQYGDADPSPMRFRMSWTVDNANIWGTSTSNFFAIVGSNANMSDAELKVAEANTATSATEIVSSATATTTASEDGSKADTTHTSVPSSESSSESSSGKHKGGGGLGTGAIAGIAVGAIIGVLIIAALAWFFLRKRRQNKKLAGGYTATDSGNAYMVDKETHGRTADSPNSPYSDENGVQHVPADNTTRDDPAITERGLPRTSTSGSQGGRSASGAQTPQGVSTNVAHLVEDGMTADEIRRLEEEERQLDDEIERAARR